MTDYISYFRVSTKQQGMSGLGLQAQREAVKGFLASHGGNVISEYTETESGKNDQRNELNNAIAEAKEKGAVLIIAKLDRLSRNISFITSLMASGIKFKCCDMPEADNFTIHIFAALAQKEREMISARTKAALAQKKASGVKLGNPNGFSKSAQKKATETKKDNALSNENTKRAIDRIEEILVLNPEASYTTIANGLNKYNLKTARGKTFTRHNVAYLLKQVKA